MEIIIIILLILLNGLFAMSEIAVISARKSNLTNEANRGSKAAKAALKLSENPDRFLSTVQVGITLIGILTGLYSGDVLAKHFAPVLQKIGIPSSYVFTVAKVTIVILVTYLSIIFGELVPKRIGLSSAEKIAKNIARPMNILSMIVSPFVWILSKSTSLVFKLLGIKNNDTKVTEEEIKLIIREGAEDGEVQAVEQDIVERVFILGDRDLESIMTPRSEIVWLDIDMTREQIKNAIRESPYAKYPVVKKDLDRIEGIVSLKDIFTGIDSPDFNLKKILQDAPYYYENTEVYKALEKMKSTHVHYGVVCDEFGSVRGVVTLIDIMEALVGEIPDLNHDPDIVLRKDGTYLVDGQCSFYDFLSYFKKLDLYSENDYNTLSGLIIDLLGNIPKEGEQVEWEKFSFEVMDMDNARIDKILVKVLG